MSNIHLRGFASMSPERRTEIARKGGKVSGGNFKNNRELARRAGQKGGSVSYKAHYEKLESDPK